MHLFLIRHGETVDNVAGIYAGTTDSALTNHGVLQASKLGQHLATSGVKATHIFSSDLQRAFKTAESIRIAQKNLNSDPNLARETKKLTILREQDFGFYEGKRFYERPSGSSKTGREVHQEVHKDDPGFVDAETKDSMTARSNTFVDQYLMELLGTVDEGHAVIVVAHGMILTHLWRSILRLFPTDSVSIAPEAEFVDRGLGLEHLGSWMNTAYLELEIKPGGNVPATLPIGTATTPDGASVVATAAESLPETPKILNLSLLVKAVNKIEHLKGVKKTRGGIGSSKHDESQKTIETFFKKKSG